MNISGMPNRFRDRLFALVATINQSAATLAVLGVIGYLSAGLLQLVLPELAGEWFALPLNHSWFLAAYASLVFCTSCIESQRFPLPANWWTFVSDILEVIAIVTAFQFTGLPVIPGAFNAEAFYFTMAIWVGLIAIFRLATRREIERRTGARSVAIICFIVAGNVATSFPDVAYLSAFFALALYWWDIYSAPPATKPHR
jgi:hypothetical protein